MPSGRDESGQLPGAGGFVNFDPAPAPVVWTPPPAPAGPARPDQLPGAGAHAPRQHIEHAAPEWQPPQPGRESPAAPPRPDGQLPGQHAAHAQPAPPAPTPQAGGAPQAATACENQLPGAGIAAPPIAESAPAPMPSVVWTPSTAAGGQATGMPPRLAGVPLVAWQGKGGRAGQRLLVYHSPHERCGIGEYGRALDRQFAQEAFDHGSASLGDARAGDWLLVHFEPAIVPLDFPPGLRAAKARGARIVLCCHLYSEEALAPYAGAYDCIVVHRQYDGLGPAARILPLGCPCYAGAEDKGNLRKRLGLPLDSLVLTSIGFLTPWKRVPELARALLARMAGSPLAIFLQLLHPKPFFGHDSDSDAVRDALAGAGGRVYFSQEFRSEGEILDRLRASDLGILYHGNHTASVSAATKQFVAARCPLVVSGSNHASDLQAGVHRVDSLDVDRFAAAAMAVAGDPAGRARLAAGMAQEYERINMRRVAAQFLDLFGSL